VMRGAAAEAGAGDAVNAWPCSAAAEVGGPGGLQAEGAGVGVCTSEITQFMRPIAHSLHTRYARRSAASLTATPAASNKSRSMSHHARLLEAEPSHFSPLRS
jgi:hypothetical protein